MFPSWSFSRLSEKQQKVNFYHVRNTNSMRKQVWVGSCVRTITLIMGETVEVDSKRTSNESVGPRAPQPSRLKNTQCFWNEERTERRKSISNISFQFNVNNLCCLCFLLLFIYLFTTFFSAACLLFFFSKASWTGKMYQTFEFSFKRLSLSLSYLYIYSSVHLSFCYLARRIHEALMRSKPDTHCWPPRIAK